MNVQVIEVQQPRIESRADKWDMDVLLAGPTYDFLLENTQQENDVYKFR